jgi:uncharacterized protein DUF3300
MRLDFSPSAKGGTMKASTLIIRGLAWMIIALLFIPPGISAQDFEQPEQIDRFRQEELDQMLAPIALYPDSLITQILMASTYPLEIVQAERWVEQNKTLTGDALDDSLKEKSWDPSIKSLCHFPDVLFAMSDKLDQTSKLGDAFLSQNDDVMTTIQQLRRKAESQGNLKTTKEQRVIHDEDAIKIEPANRQVVYVPVYDPRYVYGPWWHSAYPPYYWYHPPGVIITGGFITFRPHFFVGIDFLSWSWFDWHRHYIYVNVHKARRFHNFRQRHDSGRYFWRHNPVHRRGVAYRNKRTREQFGQKLSRRSAPGTKMGGYPIKRQKTKTVEPSRNSNKRRKQVDVSRARTERQRIQRTEKRRDKVDVSRRRVGRERIQRIEKRRDKTDVSRGRTVHKRVQRTENRRESTGAPGARPERNKLQIPKSQNSPLHGFGKKSFERKERGIQSRQGRDTRHPSGNRQRQSRGSRGRFGT